MTDYSDWIGRESVQHDIASSTPLRGLAALLDRGGEDVRIVPPLGHWLYFLPHANQSTLGPDGHPATGSDLPSFGLPRRMWAGSRITFHAPIAVASRIERRTRIAAIARKRGSSGELAFVTLHHEIKADGGLVVSEEQDLVYHEEAHARPAEPVAVETVPAETPRGGAMYVHRADPVELFRFSALTFNAHRIHFDREYARNGEGYRDLVVHGPLQAVRLMDLFRRVHPDRTVTRFAFRATAPLIVGEEAYYGLEPIEGAEAWLWVRTASRETMTAEISAQPTAAGNPADRT